MPGYTEEKKRTVAVLQKAGKTLLTFVGDAGYFDELAPTQCAIHDIQIIPRFDLDIEDYLIEFDGEVVLTAEYWLCKCKAGKNLHHVSDNFCSECSTLLHDDYTGFYLENMLSKLLMM